MTDINKIVTDHPELVEFEGETLGDTLTNLLTEVLRLREGIKEQVRMLIEGCSCVTKTECTEKLGELIG